MIFIRFRDWLAIKDESNEDKNANFQGSDIKNKMSKVIGSDTIMNPWAMTGQLVSAAMGHSCKLTDLASQRIVCTWNNACFGVSCESYIYRRNSDRQTSTKTSAPG